MAKPPARADQRSRPRPARAAAGDRHARVPDGTLRLNGQGTDALEAGSTLELYRQHLLATRQFAANARVLEQRGPDRVTATGLDRHRAYVTAAILAAVAFLEASINELYLDLQELEPSNGAQPLNRLLARLPDVWPAAERAPILHRYQLALALADAERFDQSRPPYTDAESLIQLREALVHQQPDPDDGGARLRKLERRLRQRFAPNALARATDAWFPHLCLGAGCADWAVQTAQSFSDAFCQRMSIPARGLGWREGQRPARR
ncbi:MAG TPA: hypothetical protein VLE53_02495 [Gemmatimonadaceae bacterium]|nr:hypothetical protein [Gemmatimonadaceae bacterium]